MTDTSREFHQSPFLRKAWVSLEARAIYEGRIKRVAAAWETGELHSADSVRPCALVSVPSSDHGDWTKRVEALGLSNAAVRVLDIAPPNATQPLYVSEMVIGARNNVRSFRSAWRARDNRLIGRLLGYPACCSDFFSSMVLPLRATDPVWLIGSATPGALLTPTMLSITGLPATNVMLRRLGVRAIPHFPCSFSCQASDHLSREMTALISSLGYSEEMGWLNEMVDWPIRWSALHEIAEIRTPVLKIATHTDPSVEQLTLDWHGRTNPIAGARGLAFPYTQEGGLT